MRVSPVLAAPCMIALALIALPPTADAETLEAMRGDGRYQLMEVNDKIVRLDTQTGRFELCRMQDEDWRCAAATDERQPLEDRISALSERIATLEAASQERPLQSVSAAPGIQVVDAGPSQTGTAVAELDDGAVAPVPVEPVAGSAVQAIWEDSISAEPAATGRPVDLSPVVAERSPGLIGRITGLIPSLGW